MPKNMVPQVTLWVAIVGIRCEKVAVKNSIDDSTILVQMIAKKINAIVHINSLKVGMKNAP